MNSLHPSSAICGFPFYEAAYFINKYESFDRGLYSGVIGVFSRDESDFAVSIRSALVINNRIDIFIGAGIVDGSSALDEWYETNSKMQIFNKIFNKCCD